MSDSKKESTLPPKLVYDTYRTMGFGMWRSLMGVKKFRRAEKLYKRR